MKDGKLPRFVFAEPVFIIDGFYRGQEGKILNYIKYDEGFLNKKYFYMYLVSIQDGSEKVLVSENEIISWAF